ncbi:HET-domain-containing protein [Tothia fuscella]|uniref:HET-domain-containing protein n=1 Tax=Tothia fuscella TaxID=1048955 RepID=A0A9P4TUK6_9PEZI|nr:HET-domain-containing protein [Tothia fuscella]
MHRVALTMQRLPSLGIYTYERLPSSSSFRTLELLPGTGEDEVSYHLHVSDWNHPIAYEAISYAWGDNNLKVSTLCSDKDLQVTPNLRDALLRMRYPDQSRYLWADAACIDQSNARERGHQVENMRQIYESATAVLVWLGEDEDGHIGRASLAMNELASRICERAGMSMSQVSTVDDLYDIIPRPQFRDLVLDHDDSQASLKWFFSRPWFGRLWVLQEVSSNPRVEIFCGIHILSWETVSLTAEYIASYPHVRAEFFSSNVLNAELMRNRVAHRRYTLPLLMSRARDFQTTNPLDKIYALLGMPQLTRLSPNIEANYFLSQTDLYLQVSKRCILDSGDLEILEFAQHLRQVEQDFPTWVPRWDQRKHTNAIQIPDYPAWTASRSRALSTSVDSNTPTMKLSGLALDVITRAEEIDLDQWVDPKDSAQQTLSLLHFLTAWCDDENSSPRASDTDNGRLLAVATTLASGLYYSCKITERPGRFLRDFNTHIAWVVYYSAPEDLASVHPALLEIARQTTRLVDEETEPGIQQGYWKDCVGWIRETSFHRSIFSTGNGYVGLGSNALRVDDVVCVLFGGRVPFVLRPCGGYYQFVGDAYVHGMMDGEAMDRYEKGEYREQIFEIR